MDPFGYLTVLISIILGLGMTQLLSGLGRLLHERHQVRVYWPTLVWVVLLLVIHVQTWWAMFGLSALRAWTFAAFLVVLLQPILLYLLAALVLPGDRSESATDLRANYYAQSSWFFGLAVLVLMISLVRDLVLTGHLPGGVNTGVHAVLIVGWGMGALTHREWYHRGLAVASALLLTGYIMVLFRTLP